MLPIIKVYEIDYDFIIKNYLDPKMWQKTWTLFVYKTFIVNLKIDRIDCQNEKVYFNVSLKDNNPEAKYEYEYGWENNDKRTWSTVGYSLKIDDISFLKNAIESEIIKRISTLEEYSIITSDEYKNIKKYYSNEKEKLADIASKFLDDEGVKNEEIRKVYIDNYVDNNSVIDSKLNELKSNLEYQIFSDLYLVFANATKNEKLINQVEDKLEETNNIEELKDEIEEYTKYIETSDFEESMTNCLEDI